MEITRSTCADAVVYQIASLRVLSDLPLSGVPPCRDQVRTGDEIVIHRASVPTSLSAIDVVFPDGECNEKELLLKVPDVARYLVRGGREVLVEQAEGSSLGDVSGYLLGSIFGVLCHQRGIPPLHASAIDVPGGCVAFVGESGAGKSTLAAALAECGHQIIADDVCCLQAGKEAATWVWPNVGRIRLWEDAMTALGYGGLHVERVWRGLNKYFIPLHSPPSPTEPRRLSAIYHLRAASDGRTTSIERVRGAEAVEVLMQHVYRLGLAEHMGYKPAAFMACAAVAGSVPVFRFTRPLGFDALAEALNLLKAHIHAN
jgi:hypothetical protein